jgi:hypothetical protein
MFSTTTRHRMVAFGLGAIALVTGASAAGLVNHTRHGATAVAAPAMPFVSGDLGEVIVHAPGELGEIIVRAPADLGEVLVQATRITAPDRYLAEVVVTAPRFEYSPPAAEATATLVAAQ